jgi:DNA-binding CsgD family transcriptional regulator
MNVKNIKDIDLDRHFFMTSGNELKHMAKPLEKINITGFGFSRLNADGIDDSLSTCPEALKLFVEEKYYKHVYFGNVEQYNDCVVSWHELGEDNEQVAKFLGEQRNQFGVENGITIVKRFDDMVEFYYFFSRIGNELNTNVYLSNMDYLYGFIDYFNDVGAELKKESAKHGTYYPNAKDNSLLTRVDLNQSFKSDAVSNVEFETMLKFYRLTPREHECIHWLSLGKTYEDVGMILSISSRTVKAHVQSIKAKLSCSTQFQLGKMFGWFSRKNIIN